MMNKICIFSVLILFVSGCVTTSKTVKSDRDVKKPSAAPTVKVASKTKRAPRPIKDSAFKGPITYSQITNVISEFLSIQATENVSGEPVFLGYSENNLVSLKIIGDANNVSEASIRLSYPEDIETVESDLNNAMMLRFFRNTLPGFEDSSNYVKDIIDKFYKMPTGSEEREQIALGKKVIEVLYNKAAKSITLKMEFK
ncbi:hypothetical protein ACFL0P_05290 [Candidatus Omnitrophota bacterium]